MRTQSKRVTQMKIQLWMSVCLCVCVKTDEITLLIWSTHSVSSEVGYSFSRREYLTFNSSPPVLPLKFGK